MRARQLGFVAVLGGLLLCGCARKFTRERFDMVQERSDTRADVQRILGKPTADLNDQWLYDERDRHYSAMIYFDAGGRVQAKEWMDAKTGEWTGHNPNANPPPQGEVRSQTQTKRRMDH